MPRTLRLTVQYDGTAYVGWQRQARGTSIQGLLEDAVARIEGSHVTVHGAGRTDAGVHALGQVASVTIAHAISTSALLRALNAALPRDVRVVDVRIAAPEFHARHSALLKTYRYDIVNAPVAGPFDVRYAWHVVPVLDVERMRRAVAALEGRHDFAAFRSSGSAVTTTERTLTTVRLDTCAVDAAAGTALAGTRLALTLTGDGFLRHMARAIAGTLVEIGAGRRHPDDMARLLAAGRRSEAGPTAPAQGLWLVAVVY